MSDRSDFTGNITDNTRILIGKKAFQYIPKTYTAADATRIEKQKVTIEDLAKEKNPAINFDLLSPEEKAKAKEKLKAFDEIVKPRANQKQENHNTKFKSEDQEMEFWYPNMSGPGPVNAGKPSSTKITL